MAVYVVTGKLGAGKTLVALSRIQYYLNSNRRVATNLDLYLEKLVNPWAKKTDVMRLPDIPKATDLTKIGLGYEGEFKGDEHNGLICLDECAKWLNSRTWSEKSRKELVDWMIHARKRRWDIILIIQDIAAMDKQMRDLFAEHVVYCRRFDKLSIPFVTSITKLFIDGGIRSFRLHVGIVKYGDTESSLIVDRWWYRGTSLFDAYDTEQGFSDDTCELNSLLPPNTIYGRYITKWEKFKNEIKAPKTSTFLFGGLGLGLFLAVFLENNPFSLDRGAFTCSDSWEKNIGCDISPAQLETIMLKHKTKVSPEGKSGAGAPAEDLMQEDALDKRVFITASQTSSEGFEYVFYDKDRNVWEPSAHGYKARWVDYCKAQLIGLNDSYFIGCFPDDLSASL